MINDTLRLRGGILLVGLVYVGLLLFLVSKNMFLLALICSALPFAASLVVKRDVFFFLTLFVTMSLLGLPAIRVDTVSLGLIMQLFVVVFYVQDILIHHKKLERTGDVTLFFLWIFVINLFVTASVRGFGFYRLGGDMIGGMVYVQILLGFFFLMYLLGQRFSEKQIVRIFTVFVFCSFLPFLVQMAVVKIPALMPMSDFFVFSKTRVSMALNDAVIGRSGRYETVVNFSYLLICIGSIFWVEKKRILGLLALVGVLLLLLSGFRRYALLSLLVLGAVNIMLAKSRIRAAFLWVGIAVCMILMLYLTASHLPHNIQRAVAILPGIDVTYDAARSGQGSNEWRMEIYEYCLEDISNHLLLGKGMLKTLDETLFSLSYVMTHGKTPYYAFMAGNYHSGIFEQVLTFGVVGFLSFFLFCVVSMIRVWRHFTRNNDASRLWRIMVSMWVVCGALLVDYYFVRGEFVNFIATFLLFFGMMILAYNAHRTKLESAALRQIDEDSAS